MIVNKTITSLAILLLLNISASGVRTKLHRRLVETSNDVKGICQLMVETQGYACEEHKVTTEDGYILSLQRIPTGRSNSKKGAKAPVLLQHGLISDASTWLDSPDQSLGFILADNGFDVWLANVRGTSYSSGHTSLTPDSSDYWNWSWDELAIYDLPAFFRYVHDKTGQKLHYVGHSLGTLMALGAFSREEVLNIARSAAMLSPIAYMGQMLSPLARAAADLFIADALYWLGLKKFAPGGGAASKLLKDICTTIDCTSIENAITGPNCCLNSSSSLSKQQPTATKNMIHLAQMIRKGTIEMYDYGNGDDNNKHYGQGTPPAYNMTSIPNDLPLFLGYGGQDLLSDVKDVQTLIDTLSDHDPNKLVLLYREDYAHLDFVHGTNANQVVYDPLMAFFERN
ncbi:triacylglycerol lipase 2-like [Andrographis paniculata]|uniref:triacylglycerol lipase 2-like n=1 Tax=Andrographis paniculata TaxID=175694 RepID=UPI0021E81E2C|nr:triacylglycerol lipase 2-like [Andrographis paniculata]